MATKELVKPRILTDEQKKEAFDMLAYKTQFEVAKHFGLEKHYDSKRQMVAYISRMYQKMAEKPWKHGISDDKAALVAQARSDRRVSPPPKDGKALEEMKYEKMELKDLMKRTAERAVKIMDYKLGQISKSPKKMKEMSMADVQKVGVIAGIAFDKSQIMKGEATENIAIHAKVDNNLTPEQLIELVQKERENNYINNTG